MSDKILIIDFDDSFTFNIANVLYAFNPSVKVMGHQEFFKVHFENIMNSKEKHAVILGPGPGHPDEYSHYLDLIKRLMKADHLYVMGICLGHQLMAQTMNKKIDYSKHQMHGQSVEIAFNGQVLAVQRYNSLAVWENGLEVDVLKYPRGVSYQFHPESIGTAQNEVFFRELLDFV